MIYSSSQRKLVLLPAGAAGFLLRRVEEAVGLVLMIFACALILAYLSYAPSDPSPLRASAGPYRNLLGGFGSAVSDVGLQTLGAAYLLLIATLLFWGWRMFAYHGLTRAWLRITLLPVMLIFAALAFSVLPGGGGFAAAGTGGAIGQIILHALMPLAGGAHGAAAIAGAVLASVSGVFALGFDPGDWNRALHTLARFAGRCESKLGFIRHKLSFRRFARHNAGRRTPAEREQIEPVLCRESPPIADDAAIGPALAPSTLSSPPDEPTPDLRGPPPRTPAAAIPAPTPSTQEPLVLARQNDYHLPSSDLLASPLQRKESVSPATLQEQARLLEAVLQDFGVLGRIVNIRPGPVVTIYELDPAPGTKSSRVIGLADDIARSLSAVAVRIAVVPGHSAIGIELPNERRQIVSLREVLENDVFERSAARLALILGVDTGGNPVVEDLARMPHLLIAGTTGSGKSVGINTMILSLLYRLPPERCRLIMIDPKMLELSIYDGIPHLLTPVVTEAKKAVVALKWAVKEMENRYRGMAQLGVRNIESYNAKAAEIARHGAGAARRVHTGFDETTGQPLYEDQRLALHHLPYIVVVIDEMADLMMVAGKEIEAAIQRLAQMARAAGIHLIMATQRPSVDVITGTIKANFPSRISFRVTSKIDSRTILGESGAEQLLGHGDMLVMLSGGRVDRVHGPLVADYEVEAVVNFLKRQGTPDYLDAVTEDEDLSREGGGPAAIEDESDDLYDRAVALVARERKASTSFIQRHLQIGYNRAARLVERMEVEGAVGAANHVGKREVLIARRL